MNHDRLMNPDGDPWLRDNILYDSYALQNYTCFDCINNYCNDYCIKRCEYYLKEICKDCIGFAECTTCDRMKCNGWGEFSGCNKCGTQICQLEGRVHRTIPVMIVTINSATGALGGALNVTKCPVRTVRVNVCSVDSALPCFANDVEIPRIVLIAVNQDVMNASGISMIVHWCHANSDPAS